MIVILSGPVHSGKTTLIQKSLSRWAARGLLFGGFLSIAVRNERGESEYDFLDLKEGLRLPFLRRAGEPEWETVGPFYFVPRTLDAARSLLASANPEELLIVDEFGPLELAGGGLWPALRRILSDGSFRVLLVVREDILEDAIRVLGTPPALILDARDPSAPALLDGCFLGPERAHEDQG
jgi:nucleoside-triphosphatase THEP1